EKYLSYKKYFPFERLFEWQTFCIALHLCAFKENGLPRWPNLFMMIARGAGKDGFIAFESFCVLSPASGLMLYDVDICANLEEQAMRPMNDVIDVLENVQNAKLRKHFSWTKQQVMGAKLRGVMKGRTNSPSSRDGMRSGMIVFNEIHQYKDWRNIEVFKSGLGKGQRTPREMYVTTDGDVRDGPLDEMLEQMGEILRGEQPDGGFLPFICKLDKPDEVHNPALWEKANPSLPYMPMLRAEYGKKYAEWKRSPNTNTAFMTKRFNLPEGNPEVCVASWNNIKAACKPLPDLQGRDCIAGIDATSRRDFAAAGLWFNVDGLRCWITHSWLCLRSPDLEKLKYPWKRAAEEGLLTPVDDEMIPPELVVGWVESVAEFYNIRAVALDYYRFSVYRQALEGIGFSTAKGAPRPIKTVRPSDLGAVVPLIDGWFVKKEIAWGEDHHLMRWYTNNVRMMQTEADKRRGVYTYGKIEPRTRKTDGFMALAAAATMDAELTPGPGMDWEVLGGVRVFDN
ncbi:MAG: terminase large subunit, partial [Oscillospiraceae bacterium]|nr:terminase large subunit [Oscillospiraceae bacterium]